MLWSRILLKSRNAHSRLKDYPWRAFSTITASGLELPFSLEGSFLDQYKTIQPPFGYNGLGEIVYLRTYSRLLPNGKKEEWWQTVQRVVEGTYSIQQEYINSQLLGWDEDRAQRSAQEMYDLIFNMKFLPPGVLRGMEMICRSWSVGDGNRCGSQEKSVSCPQ